MAYLGETETDCVQERCVSEHPQLYSAEVQDSLDDSSDTVEKLFRLPV